MKSAYSTPGFRNGFGSLYRAKTRKHLRTSRSIRTSTGQVCGLVTRDVETAGLKLEEGRLKRWTRWHEERRAD